LKRLASFTNPKFYELQKLRMPIYYKTTPRIIACFEEDERFLILPRGCMEKIREICEKIYNAQIQKIKAKNIIEKTNKQNNEIRRNILWA